MVGRGPEPLRPKMHPPVWLDQTSQTSQPGSLVRRGLNRCPKTKATLADAGAAFWWLPHPLLPCPVLCPVMVLPICGCFEFGQAQDLKPLRPARHANPKQFGATEELVSTHHVGNHGRATLHPESSLGEQLGQLLDNGRCRPSREHLVTPIAWRPSNQGEILLVL